MSLGGRINRLVKTLSEKDFYGGENIAPGKFTLEVITAIKKFQNSIESGRNIRVVINAFRVFDPESFQSVGRNCQHITVAIKEGITKCLEKHCPLTIHTSWSKERKTGRENDTHPFENFKTITTSLGDNMSLDSIASEAGLAAGRI